MRSSKGSPTYPPPTREHTKSRHILASYWALPSLLLFGILSLFHLHHTLSIYQESHSRSTVLSSFKRNGLPGMHRRHDGFDTSNYEPPPRATRQERTGGASKPFLSNKPPQGILQYAASQSQSRQQIRLGYLVRHPHFHERIWSVKEELDKAVESRTRYHPNSLPCRGSWLPRLRISMLSF